ncbi:TPA: type I toxin-antitoxin system Ibs family toxin [Salmonella enterica]|nr:type I toxin-antitoxin system Ibs family toxin [Salmonella enterica]ECC1506259.1 type I toxin-antitoxin system Ibs family toxin [Salmonella enterica subsp. houtenae]ECC1560874.1 type I toxin-antitoxin system Ibs family toxin [Salmonella enterica subsp. salamae]ECC2865434.1 type I toxin-antitoxin system Ibs family toxin [Salmonella enterica subsp. enterica]EEJ9247585.1 type I toxin-antitoxin system Ibs family toxin [Salmonella enterica subsp. enterica serovar Muenchen]
MMKLVIILVILLAISFQAY